MNISKKLIALVLLTFASISFAGVSEYKDEIASVHTFVCDLQNNPDSQAKREIIKWWEDVSQSFIHDIKYDYVSYTNHGNLVQALIYVAAIVKNEEIAFDKKIDKITSIIIEYMTKKNKELYKDKDSLSEEVERLYKEKRDLDCKLYRIKSFAANMALLAGSIGCLVGYGLTLLQSTSHSIS